VTALEWRGCHGPYGTFVSEFHGFCDGCGKTSVRVDGPIGMPDIPSYVDPAILAFFFEPAMTPFPD
jgi:hypothetical protein